MRHIRLYIDTPELPRTAAFSSSSLSSSTTAAAAGALVTPRLVLRGHAAPLSEHSARYHQNQAPLSSATRPSTAANDDIDHPSSSSRSAVAAIAAREAQQLVDDARKVRYRFDNAGAARAKQPKAATPAAAASSSSSIAAPAATAAKQTAPSLSFVAAPPPSPATNNNSRPTTSAISRPGSSPQAAAGAAGKTIRFPCQRILRSSAKYAKLHAEKREMQQALHTMHYQEQLDARRRVEEQISHHHHHHPVAAPQKDDDDGDDDSSNYNKHNRIAVEANSIMRRVQDPSTLTVQPEPVNKEIQRFFAYMFHQSHRSKSPAPADLYGSKNPAQAAAAAASATATLLQHRSLSPTSSPSQLHNVTASDPVQLNDETRRLLLQPGGVGGGGGAAEIKQRQKMSNIGITRRDGSPFDTSTNNNNNNNASVDQEPQQQHHEQPAFVVVHRPSTAPSPRRMMNDSISTLTPHKRRLNQEQEQSEQQRRLANFTLPPASETAAHDPRLRFGREIMAQALDLERTTGNAVNEKKLLRPGSALLFSGGVISAEERLSQIEQMRDRFRMRQNLHFMLAVDEAGGPIVAEAINVAGQSMSVPGPRTPHSSRGSNARFEKKRREEFEEQNARERDEKQKRSNRAAMHSAAAPSSPRSLTGGRAHLNIAYVTPVPTVFAAGLRTTRSEQLAISNLIETSVRPPMCLVSNPRSVPVPGEFSAASPRR